jgi:hypothetical protein
MFSCDIGCEDGTSEGDEKRPEFNYFMDFIITKVKKESPKIRKSKTHYHFCPLSPMHRKHDRSSWL